jgi:hypothetical protein
MSTIFFNGKINEKVFIVLVERICKKWEGKQSILFLKALYGLKQGHGTWYLSIDLKEFFLSNLIYQFFTIKYNK